MGSDVKEDQKILISVEPLRKVLQALIGPPYLIRELQMTMDISSDNAINKVCEEYNKAVAELNLTPPHNG